jgi:xanthine dehydrogenase small subunit
MSDHRASSDYRSIMLSQSMLKLFAQSAETMEVVA